MPYRLTGAATFGYPIALGLVLRQGSWASLRLVVVAFFTFGLASLYACVADIVAGNVHAVVYVVLILTLLFVGITGTILYMHRGEAQGVANIARWLVAVLAIATLSALFFGAFLLDYLIIAAYIVLLIIVSVGLGLGPLRSVFWAMFADPNSSEFSAFLLLVLPVILYFALCEHSSWQATWGKRKMGLRVTDTHGSGLSLPRSFARSLLKLVPWELTHACLWRIPGWPLAPTPPSPIITAGLVLVWVLVGAYLVSILVSKEHQSLYDWIAGTSVVVAPRLGRTSASQKNAD